MNAKIATWVGAGLIVVGVALGFVGTQDCGSAFLGPDEKAQRTAEVNAMFSGQPYIPPDCSSELDLTIPVWILIGLGALLAGGGAVAWADSRTKQATEEPHGDVPIA